MIKIPPLNTPLKVGNKYYLVESIVKRPIGNTELTFVTYIRLTNSFMGLCTYVDFVKEQSTISDRLEYDFKYATEISTEEWNKYLNLALDTIKKAIKCEEL